VVETDDRIKGGEVGLAARAFYHSAHVLARLLAFLYFRAYVRHADRMPRKGPVILAPVHRSNLDVPILGSTCPRRLRYFAKDSLFINGFWTWVLTAVGAFPVRREATDRQAIEAAYRVLERGEPLAMFPEGERKSGPDVQPFLHGVAYVACRAQVPVIPVGIGGSERAMPKGKYVPRPRKLVYVYGEPVDPPPLEGARVPRAGVKQLSADLHDKVQELFDEAQRIAGCPNP